MKSHLFLALLLAPFSGAFAATMSTTEISMLAADRVGNGGFAHVCRDNRGRITSARLLDLWETNTLYPHSSNEPVETQVETALKKLKSFSPNAYRVVNFRYQAIKNAIVKTPRALSMTEDAFPPYEPARGCKYEQVARFEPVLTETGTSGLRINSEIYDSPRFSNSDRAALFIHEAVYLVDRLRNQATNSQRARTLTAHLMSQSPVPNAVRMLFLYLIGTQYTNEGVKNPIFALPDPNRIQVQMRIYDIEDISYDGSTPEQKTSQYRCTLGTQLERPGDTQGDTGYQNLGDLVRYNPVSLVRAAFGAHEHFKASRDLPDTYEYTVMNMVNAQCFKKDDQGKEVRVKFSAELSFEDAECMRVSADGSTFVDSGERCSMQLETDEKQLKDYPELDQSIAFGVVRKL